MHTARTTVLILANRDTPSMPFFFILYPLWGIPLWIEAYFPVQQGTLCLQVISWLSINDYFPNPSLLSKSSLRR